MVIKVEGRRTGEFILGEANGTRSRDNVTVSFTAAGTYAAGTVMAQNTTSKKWLPHVNGGSSGLQTAKGVLYSNVTVEAAGDVEAVMVVRDAELKRGALEWDASVDTTAKEDAALLQLEAAGIVTRWGE